MNPDEKRYAKEDGVRRRNELVGTLPLGLLSFILCDHVSLVKLVRRLISDLFSSWHAAIVWRAYCAPTNILSAHRPLTVCQRMMQLTADALSSGATFTCVIPLSTLPPFILAKARFSVASLLHAIKVLR